MQRVLLGFIILFCILVVLSSAYVVPEWEQVVITRFGAPTGEPITEPGLKFKLPLIDTVRRFDKRFLEWDGKRTEIPTKEKRNILVDTYARWRITDPQAFLESLKDERTAQSRLDGILNGETRDAIARHNLAELIRTSDREPQRDESQPEEDSTSLEPIEVGREAIRREILASAKQRITSQQEKQSWGIELLDVQFKRVNYVEEVRESVFQRMIAERRRIADRYRSQGEGEASRIRGDKERELKRIQSEAYRTAQEVVGKADAEATEIYAGAYNRSADTRDFYEFLQTMESYSQTFDKDTTLVLSTKGDFYRFLVEGGQ
jgi:membrane protease subunit HflC